MNQSSFTAPTVDSLNSRLPSLEFTDLLAANDFGAVYLARQRSLDRKVAVKVIAPHLCKDPDFQHLLQRTASSMAKLNHPNLISVFDSGNIDGMPYIVMEFVPGQPLAHSMEGQPVDLRQAISLVQGICAGLAHAHNHQIIHGSLNPANILLNQKAEPKIGNFGISFSSNTGVLATANAHFLAPETSNAPDVRSDIYAIGAILYELVTGQPHHPDAPPPSTISSCGPAVDDVWRIATHPDPDQRFQNAKILAVTLSNAVPASRPPLTAAMPASQRLRAGAGRHVSASPRPSQVLTSHTAGNSKLVRNLSIIAVLLVAVAFAWKNLEAARIANDKKNREILALNKTDKERIAEEARKKALEQRDQRRDAMNQASADSSRPEIVESPEESLTRLRDQLAAGKRDELPVGSVKKGECDYFLVSQPMTWPDAAWFAEQHGGHLAIPGPTADLAWLAGHVSNNQGIWIGAASSARNTWALVDCSAWTPGKKPSGVGNYLVSDKFGFLRAENATARHPFLIQWHRDGTNPGALASVLASAQSSVTQTNPVFPAGTRAFGSRHYLYISRPVTWREAVDLAKAAGGNLAVPSDTAEFISLEEMANDIAAERGIWVGGYLKGDHWLWSSGEPWQTAKWAKDADTTRPDSAALLLPNHGWHAQNQSDPASGFIIEWSQDVKPTTAANSTTPVPAGEAATLVKRARKLIVAADAKRTEQLAVNAKRFTDDLATYLRSLNSGDQSDWTPHVNRLQSSITNHRIPSSVPRSSGIDLSDQMAKLVEYHSRKQDKLDLEFHAEAEKLRIAFVARLRDEKAKADQAGQAKIAASIGENLELAANLANWVQSFGVELQPKNPLAANPKPQHQSQNNFPEPGITSGNGDIQIE